MYMFWTEYVSLQTQQYVLYQVTCVQVSVLWGFVDEVQNNKNSSYSKLIRVLCITNIITEETRREPEEQALLRSSVISQSLCRNHAAFTGPLSTVCELRYRKVRCVLRQVTAVFWRVKLISKIVCHLFLMCLLIIFCIFAT